MKKTVLVLSEYYLPGYKAGGPIRTVSNIVARLNPHVNFKLITRDRDLGDPHPYSGLKTDTWLGAGHVEIIYLSPGFISSITLCKLLMTTQFDTVYLNELFSPKFSMLPLVLFRLKLTRGSRMVLAPRGSCAKSALSLRSLRKSVFLKVSKGIGLFNNIVWHASSEYEAADIANLFVGETGLNKDSLSIENVPDMPAYIVENNLTGREKRPGVLRIIFLGRIARMKNLHYALALLSDLQGDVIFDIYGPSEDKQYWEECSKQISVLPQNIHVSYCGEIDHIRVASTFPNYHLLLLPTLGENFGHAILEAFSSGCPVIISNQTPWRNLERKGVGWDIPLEGDTIFKEVLQRCVDMSQPEFDKLSEQSRLFSRKIIEDDKIIQQHLELFCAGDNKRL